MTQELVVAATPAPPRPSRLRMGLHVGFGVVGVGAMAAMVASVGADKMAALLGRCAAYLPILFAIEALRLGTEVLAAWVLSPRIRRSVPWLVLVRANLVAYAVGNVMPAGRTAAEATKAAMIAKRIGGAHAAAIAATMQSLCLFAGAAIAVVCAIGAWFVLGPSPVAWGCALSAVMTTVAYVVMQFAARWRMLGGWFGRRFAKLRTATASFQDALAEIPVLHPAAAAVWFGNRILQTLQFGILVYAVGGRFTLGSALLAEGINVAGGAAGDFIPGQLGATDGAFALAASSLHVGVADAIAIAMMAHFILLAGAALCATTPLWWRDPATVAPTEAAPAEA